MEGKISAFPVRGDPVNEQERNQEKKSETPKIIKMFAVIPAYPAGKRLEHCKQEVVRHAILINSTNSISL